MRTNLSKVLGCIFLAGTCCATQAQYYQSYGSIYETYGTYEEITEGGYLGVAGGAAFVPDFKISSRTFGFDRANSEAATGYRVDVIGGYQFNQHLALELNSGVVHNNIDFIGGLPVEPDRLVFWQVPLMANVVFTQPLCGPMSLYVGGGVGGVFTTMDLNVRGQNFSDTDTVFGYQAFAGFRYALTEIVDLGIGYKFMGTERHSWDDDGVDLSSNQIYSHSVLATFNFRF